MIATETGGRGIDWPVVEHVVNFQMPTSAVCWLHRVGRTGRIGADGLVTNFVGAKDQQMSELLQTRLAAGKDLHGAFSRRRSLMRRMKTQRKDAEEAAQAEVGAVRLAGGIEFIDQGSDDTQPASADADHEASTIGYLDTFDEELEDVIARRSRRRRQGAPVASKSAADIEETLSGKEHDSLRELRDNLLASDSESDDDGAADGPEDVDDEDEGEPRAPSKKFSWDSLADSEGGAVGPTPHQRGLQGRRDEGGERDKDARRYSRQEKPGGRGPANRKGLGTRDANKVAAGSNYSSPDDDLLL